MPATKSAVVLALTTETDEERAEALARTLLDQRLVACVSLRPVRALYRWQGQLEESLEVELLLKTSPERLAALEAAVRELHSYDTPEWLCWQAEASGPYAAWAWEATSSLSEP
ncbi:divalent-cation tolerance protein CutA [Synechococcus sp. FGCU-3]|jgi:periplasmic divalent cation tolerance protein|nr:divalent-cation tolerance protein CutA [Synechococcus sp. FGCU3]